MSPTFSQLYDAVKGLPQPWNAIALWAILLVVVIASVFRMLKFVHQGEYAMKLRRGRVVKKKGKVGIYGPGIRCLTPIDTLVRVSVRDRTFNLGTTSIKHGDYDVVDVDATVTLSVLPEGIYFIHFRSDELERRVVALCLGLLRPILNSLEGRFEVSEPVAQAFAVAAIPALAGWGFTNPIIDITDVRPNAQALIAKAIAESGSRLSPPSE